MYDCRNDVSKGVVKSFLVVTFEISSPRRSEVWALGVKVVVNECESRRP